MHHFALASLPRHPTISTCAPNAPLHGLIEAFPQGNILKLLPIIVRRLPETIRFTIKSMTKLQLLIFWGAWCHPVHPSMLLCDSFFTSRLRSISICLVVSACLLFELILCFHPNEKWISTVKLSYVMCNRFRAYTFPRKTFYHTHYRQSSQRMSSFFLYSFLLCCSKITRRRALHWHAVR